jgi:hypothetical protein
MGSGGSSLGTYRNGPSPRRQLRNRRPTAGITLIVMMRLGGLPFGRYVQIGARRQLREPFTCDWGSEATSGTRHVYQRMQSHSVRTQAQPSLGTAARARFGLGLPFLREGAGRARRSEGNLQNRCAVCQNHACRGAEERRVFSREDATAPLQRAGGNSGPATLSARLPPAMVYDTVTRLLREVASSVVVTGGNSSAAISGRNHA